MPPLRRQYQTYIERPPEAVFAFFADLKNHARICPEDRPEEAENGLDLPAALNVRVTFRGGFWKLIHTEVVEFEPPRAMLFRQFDGPCPSWSLRRRFAPFQNGTLLTEIYEYDPGPLGAVAEKLRAKSFDAWANHRLAEAKRVLERIGRIKGPGV